MASYSYRLIPRFIVIKINLCHDVEKHLLEAFKYRCRQVTLMVFWISQISFVTIPEVSWMFFPKSKNWTNGTKLCTIKKAPSNTKYTFLCFIFYALRLGISRFSFNYYYSIIFYYFVNYCVLRHTSSSSFSSECTITQKNHNKYCYFVLKMGLISLVTLLAVM